MLSIPIRLCVSAEQRGRTYVHTVKLRRPCGNLYTQFYYARCVKTLYSFKNRGVAVGRAIPIAPARQALS